MSEDLTQPNAAVDVDEPDCEPVADPETPTEEEPVDEAVVDQRLDDVVGGRDDDDFTEEPEDPEADPTEEVGRRRFVTPGGGFGGTEAPILRAIKIARRHGLTVTSTKRSTLSPTSDHHVSQTKAFAADLSNGSAPTPQMDAVARRLGTLLGSPGFEGGVLTTTIGRLRFQLLYRTHVGGNHFNHVHIGCRTF